MVEIRHFWHCRSNFVTVNKPPFQHNNQRSKYQIIAQMRVFKVPNFASFDEMYRKYEQKNDSAELRNLLLLFVASDDPQTKESWCSDCRNSKATLEAKIEEYKFNEQLALAIVEVGPKDEWKSDNLFRTHKLQVAAVPTLISLTTGLRLVEAECANADKVAHLFSNSLA